MRIYQPESGSFNITTGHRNNGVQHWKTVYFVRLNENGWIKMRKRIESSMEIKLKERERKRWRKKNETNGKYEIVCWVWMRAKRMKRALQKRNMNYILVEMIKWLFRLCSFAPFLTLALPPIHWDLQFAMRFKVHRCKAEDFQSAWSCALCRLWFSLCAMETH